MVREKVLVSRGSEVGSVPVDNTSCRFRTTQDVELLPLSVEDARIDTGAQLAQTIRLEFKVTGGASLAALELEPPFADNFLTNLERLTTLLRSRVHVVPVDGLSADTIVPAEARPRTSS